MHYTVNKYFKMNNNQSIDFFSTTLAVLGPNELKEKIDLLLKDFCELQDIKLIEMVLDKGANINIGLKHACLHGKIHIVNFLLEKEATSIDSASIIACKKGYFDIVRLLVEKGANLNKGLVKLCGRRDMDLCQEVIEKMAELKIMIDQDTRNYLNQEYYFQYMTNKKLILYSIQCGIIVTRSILVQMDIEKILFLLMHHNTIIWLFDKYFSLRDFVVLCLLNCQYNEPIYCLKQYNSTEKKILSPNNIIDAYLDIPCNIKCEQELLKDYLANCLWKPSRYTIFPKDMQDTIYHFVLSIRIFSTNVLNCNVPKPIISMIINFLLG